MKLKCFKLMGLSIPLVSFLLASCHAPADSIYINPKSAASYEDGSKEAPFRSLDALSRAHIRPGTHIYLIGDCRHEGSLSLKGVRSRHSHPLIITSYGDGKALVHSDNSPAIHIQDCAEVIIQDISIIGPGRLSLLAISGIEARRCSHISIDGIEAANFPLDGIQITGGKHIRITESHAHDNGYCGIEITDVRHNYYKKKVRDVYIGHCLVDNNPGSPLISDNHSGNGILVGQTTDALIEYCEASNNGWDMPREGNGPVGIWGYESDRLTIQYCYSHDNKTSAKGMDGGGFDLDGGMTNSVIQYNISKDNEGAGIGLFQYYEASPWNYNIVRYNLSIEDGVKNSQSGIYVWCADGYDRNPLGSAHVYGNIIYNSSGRISCIHASLPGSFLFYDNTIVEGPFPCDVDMASLPAILQKYIPIP